MVHVLSSHGHGMVAHETAASASQQHDTMDWWLVDSGASAHIINQDTLSRVHVVRDREAASECISATGDSIGVRRSAVVRVPFVLVSGETVITELQVLVAPVKFNLLSLGRLLGRSWTVDFMPNFKVEAAGYSLRTRWCSNCGWIMSRGVSLSELVAESDSVAVATRVSLKRSPAGEKPERRDGKEGGQGSGGVLFRLGTGVEAGRPSTPSGAARCDDYEDPRGLRGIPHRVYFDGDGGHHARPEPAFGASRGSEEEGGPEESGDRAGQGSCESGGGEVLEGAPGEGTVRKGGRRGQGQERGEGQEGHRENRGRREGQEGIRAHGGRRGQEGIRAQGDRRERREGIRAHGDRRERREGIRAHGDRREGQEGIRAHGAREGVKLEGAVGETATQAAEGQSHAPEGRQGQESGAQVPCATGHSRESRYGTSHALHEGPRAQEDGLPRQGDQPRHAAQGRGAERTASPAHLGPAPQGPLCPDQGQGAAVRRSHGVRDHSGCSRAGAGAAKDATWSCDQDRGWFRVASAATGATKAQIAEGQWSA